MNRNSFTLDQKPKKDENKNVEDVFSDQNN